MGVMGVTGVTLFFLFFLLIDLLYDIARSMPDYTYSRDHYTDYTFY